MLLLQRQLGLRRYDQTAWMMLHKLRRAIVDAAPLVEVIRQFSYEQVTAVTRKLSARVTSSG